VPSLKARVRLRVPGRMGEHGGAQGVGAKLRPESNRRRRSRLLAGRRFGGAQDEVAWIQSGEAGPLDLALGCPLRGSVAMQPCGSTTSSLSRTRARARLRRVGRATAAAGVADRAAAAGGSTFGGLLMAALDELVAAVGAACDPPAVQQV
jgi:hypothetical protein